jgi:hypothetical protein
MGLKGQSRREIGRRHWKGILKLVQALRCLNEEKEKIVLWYLYRVPKIPVSEHRACHFGEWELSVW